MDENKEFLTEETEAAEISEAAEDQAAAQLYEEAAQSLADDAEQLTGEAAQSLADDAEQLPEEAAQTAAQAAPKKKRAFYFPILLSLVIVLVFLAVGIACRLFFFQGVVNTDPFGNKKATTWHFRPSAEEAAAASVDEAQVPDYYFIFEPDGTIKVESGSIEFQGNYTLRNADEDDLKEIQTANAEAGNTDSGTGNAEVGKPILVVEGTNQIDGKFLYDRKGNAFTDNNLTLSVLGNDAIQLTFDDKDYSAPKFEREGEFTKDEELLGSWSYNDEMLWQTFTFNDDGTYELKTKQNNSVERQYGIYNCKDGMLTLSYCYPDQREQPLKYTIKNDKLSLIQVIEYLGQTMEQPLKDFTRIK